MTAWRGVQGTNRVPANTFTEFAFQDLDRTESFLGQMNLGGIIAYQGHQRGSTARCPTGWLAAFKYLHPFALAAPRQIKGDGGTEDATTDDQDVTVN